MAIKAGQILHDAEGFLLDRLQTAGVSNFNIPEEQIYELGNYQAVATVRDNPELSFDMESFDVTVEAEALLTGVVPRDYPDERQIPAGTQIEFENAVPLDIISPFKAGGTDYTIDGGVLVPFLSLESANYRFGVGQNATQSFTLSGDSLYYTPGRPVWERHGVAGTPLSEQDITLDFGPSADFVNLGTASGVVSAKAVDSTGSRQAKRLIVGDQYVMDDDSTFHLNSFDGMGDYDLVDLVYSVAVSEPDGVGKPFEYPQAVHPLSTVKPAAVRSKDINLYSRSAGGTASQWERWSGVQNFDSQRQVNIEQDNEFGTAQAVAQESDVPTVSGTITVRPLDFRALYLMVCRTAGIDPTTNQVVGPLTSTPLDLVLQINHPDTGAPLKALLVEQARIMLPGAQGQVQQRLDVQAAYTSDTGKLSVFKGFVPGSPSDTYYGVTLTSWGAVVIDSATNQSAAFLTQLQTVAGASWPSGQVIPSTFSQLVGKINVQPTASNGTWVGGSHIILGDTSHAHYVSGLGWRAGNSYVGGVIDTNTNPIIGANVANTGDVTAAVDWPLHDGVVYVPYNAAELAEVSTTGTGAGDAAWASNNFITTQNGSTYYWNGTAWVAGDAP